MKFNFQTGRLIRLLYYLNDFQKISASDYFKVSIELISSRRPIDSITAVYLMVFIQRKFKLEDVCNQADG